MNLLMEHIPQRVRSYREIRKQCVRDFFNSNKIEDTLVNKPHDSIIYKTAMADKNKEIIEGLKKEERRYDVVKTIVQLENAPIEWLEVKLHTSQPYNFETEA